MSTQLTQMISVVAYKNSKKKNTKIYLKYLKSTLLGYPKKTGLIIKITMYFLIILVLTVF